jgi:transcription elongation factor Elf1
MMNYTDTNLGIRSRSSYAVENFDCPRCGSPKGETCTTKDAYGDERKTAGVTHIARVELAEGSWVDMQQLFSDLVELSPHVATTP